MNRHLKEEALSIIWELQEKGERSEAAVRQEIEALAGPQGCRQLVEEGYLQLLNGDFRLTERGEEDARDITRRNRLAERLLVDVLELGNDELDTTACELEHILSKGVEESICTLLGHPKECPHGAPIPPGKCCTRATDLVESLVTPLHKMEAGQEGKVVYILTTNHPYLHKLMSVGIVPGLTIKVHQTSPIFVIQVEEMQLALEPDIAKEIYLRKG
ncbi:MAG: metal-dependent transcriptional regulator [Armatimonadetes bacterium]|nr:metal-dependent transcriptional regulator [Armatimonadota bacterium]